MKVEQILNVACVALVRKPYGKGKRRGKKAVQVLTEFKRYSKLNIPGLEPDQESTIGIKDLVSKMEAVLVRGSQMDLGAQAQEDKNNLRFLRDTVGSLEIKGIRLADIAPHSPKAANDNKEPLCSECGHLTHAVCSHCGKPYKPRTH